MKDTIFDKPIKKSFEFDSEVAAVFDDMLARSIPLYKEMQQLSKEFLLEYLEEKNRVYDLGCSTASFLLSVEKDAPFELELIGIDNSQAMLNHAQKKVDIFNSAITLFEGDILEYAYNNADAFSCHYTLQFIRPLQREKLIQTIAAALNNKGILLFSEKVISADKTLNKAQIDYYHHYKKSQGYSEYEIMQKREALENVLIPYTVEENIAMCTQNGFSHCEVLSKWVNFATFIAVK